MWRAALRRAAAVSTGRMRSAKTGSTCSSSHARRIAPWGGLRRSASSVPISSSWTTITDRGCKPEPSKFLSALGLPSSRTFPKTTVSASVPRGNQPFAGHERAACGAPFSGNSLGHTLCYRFSCPTLLGPKPLKLKRIKNFEGSGLQPQDGNRPCRCSVLFLPAILRIAEYAGEVGALMAGTPCRANRRADNARRKRPSRARCLGKVSGRGDASS
jgi:hypothetical protein